MELGWHQFQPYAALVASLLLAFPVAWNRERHSDLVGVRTFPLVAVGACAYMLLGAIGAAAAMSAWGFAVALAVINWLVFRVFMRLKVRSDRSLDK